VTTSVHLLASLDERELMDHTRTCTPQAATAPEGVPIATTLAEGTYDFETEMHTWDF
jgi:hypothetical protein